MTQPAPKTRYILRTCNPDMTAHGGFVWPTSGPVECPDWDPTPTSCGRGLHGFLDGKGDGCLANWTPDAKWLVVAVTEDVIIDLVGKVKFPRGEVIHCGDRLSATDFIAALGCRDGVVGAAVRAGDRGTATAGYGGTATAGYGGTATAGDHGTATAGDHGTATAGDGGTATAGDGGTATAGYGGTATAGERGEIRIRTYHKGRCRTICGVVGEDGILPNVPYIVRDGQLVRR